MEDKDWSYKDEEENASDSPLYELNETNTCHPCKLVKKLAFANKYCIECEEMLCEDCVISHVKRKATASHKPVPTDKSYASIILCTPCKDDGTTIHAATYCEECEEYLCNDCTRSHGKRKATTAHKPKALEDFDNKALNTRAINPFCEPCKDNDREIRSLSYCEECDKHLCDSCTEIHRSKKATNKHYPVPGSVFHMKRKETTVQDQKLCDPCQFQNIEKDATSYCGECEVLLCAACTNYHCLKNMTKSHILESPDCVEYITRECDICEKEDKKAVMFCKTCEKAICETCKLWHEGQSSTKSHPTEIIPDRKLERLIRCDNCIENIIKAEKFCTVCEENYCVGCVSNHRKLKATRGHKLIRAVSVQIYKKAQRKEVALCGECGKDEGLSKYCSECQHYLCKECCEIHRRSRFTMSHKLQENDEIEDVNIQDCDSCKLPGSAESYCEQCGEFFCTICNKHHQKFKETSGHEIKSVQDGILQRMAQQQCIEDIQLRNSQRFPGKPRSLEIMVDTVTLTWDPPSTIGEGDCYQISYKESSHGENWKFYQGELKSSTAVISDLKSNTAFVFQVCVVNEDCVGPYSEQSDEIFTLESQASRLVQASVLIEKGNPSPSKYALPLSEIREARNQQTKTNKFQLGAPPTNSCKPKTIMLVGAKGTGKSTLVDGIVNYVLGVKWDDPFRFTVKDVEQKVEAEWITCYTLNPEMGSRLDYPLNIIDTPSFGAIRDLGKDLEIVQQFRQLFTENEPKCVKFIDAVCFVIKAPDARLTAVQSYIFQSIMSLFGRDIENNICSLVTFADGIDPPVLAALKQSELPFGKSFLFNNSGLFAKNFKISSSNLSSMFWDMGLKRFRAFFHHLEQVETNNLQLTRDVLDERSRLESTIKILQPLLHAGLTKVNNMKQEIRIIDEYTGLIKDNQNFEYEVEETHQKKKELQRGQYHTNCIMCHFTCHENGTSLDREKIARLSCMGSNGCCNSCPDKCHWTKHTTTPYKFEYAIVKVRKIYAEMQEKYNNARGKLLSQEKIVEKLGEELNNLQDDIEDMMVAIKTCNERLKEIALRPNPLTMTEHIDLMIENEKLEKKEGFMQRINILNDFRKKAQISIDVENISKEARTTLGAVGKKRD
ncbi:uncharacterized protein LOC132717878 [Ruditapes philippinarum]|uniref:uncharacterized protein LOC132717878 n=1 Tax=Ruditapes philippinarum TaxID=129788 RepID=UPI00295BC260|nr:uncharacterized protein LOC132717878 [Ruditapes philippinarum]XP_060557447.1 uncharacterized protein LOC132717878 [Ruditapes philippinarum]